MEKSNNWRLLKRNELKDGLYVQCGYPTDDIKYRTFSNVIYKLILHNDSFFYTVDGANWKISSDLVIDNWCETDETIRYNRDKKINDILNDPTK